MKSLNTKAQSLIEALRNAHNAEDPIPPGAMSKSELKVALGCSDTKLKLKVKAIGDRITKLRLRRLCENQVRLVTYYLLK